MPFLKPVTVPVSQPAPALQTPVAPLAPADAPKPASRQAATDQVLLGATGGTQGSASVSVSFELQYFQHTVKRGDNLSKIARLYLGDPNQNMDIYKANRDVMRNPDDLRIGMVIRVPVPPDMKPPEQKPEPEPVAPLAPDQAPQTQYTVRRGDTLSSIALDTLGDSERYLEIFKANRHQLKDPDALRQGMVLNIPHSPPPATPEPVTPPKPTEAPTGPAPVNAAGLTPRAQELFAAMQRYQQHQTQVGNAGRARTTEAQMLEIARELDSAGQAFGVDPKMMLALFAHESGGINPGARSHTGAGGLGQLTSVAIRQVHFMAGIGKGRTGTEPYNQFKANFVQSTRAIRERYDIKANVWTSVAYMSYELNERDRLGKGVEKALKRYGDPHVPTYANKVNAEHKTLFGDNLF
ncbi:MAG TPA: LysM peptidoglycan-binding domain-containing protein [Candidatus Obscuribacterales bacterium]